MLGFDLSNAASLERYRNEFEELQKVGSGGFSTVYKVRNKRDQKLYALKVVKIKPSQYKDQIADSLEKVLGEAKLLAGLKHSNILQYHGCWIDADLKTEADAEAQEQIDLEGELELVMYEESSDSCGLQFEKPSASLQKKDKHRNYVKPQISEDPTDNIFGTNLHKYKQIRVYLLSELAKYSLQKHTDLRNQKARESEDFYRRTAIENYKMILQIIEGLSYIHSKKIIHRDIKLQNIVIGADNQCKIIDFGLAKKVRNLNSLNIDKFTFEEASSEDELEKHSSSIGTKIFSSPEQTSSDSYDHRTDIYSLALVIGILFSYYKTAHEELQLLSNLRQRKLEEFKIDNRLKQILYKCLGEQKQRPDLNEVKSCIKKLLRELLLYQQNEEESKGVLNLGSFSYIRNNLKLIKRMPLSQFQSMEGIKSNHDTPVEKMKKKQISVKI